MKFLKKTILVFTLVISFCLLNTNVKAFENTHEVNYDLFYNNVILKAQEENSDFNYNDYPYFMCYFRSKLYCFFYKTEDLEKFTFEYKVSSLYFTQNQQFELYFTETDINFSYIIVKKRDSYNMNILTNAYMNISEYKDLTNVIYLENGISEKEELEITVTGTEILTSMLDKTKNIYEVLIANQLFVLCSCILLSYLVFIILYKTIRK